ncbi:maleylpyruvate isomerase family mycothiol-dependent enzyme [Aquipuribacter sp. SD81]|uniref:maleylpyruvate isomerase family mycothiol-dependent enzyme n=1 Tax=Aquipuribacter sp. SD81 TaxID=3127703 RepID=UPI003019F7FD
MQHEEHLVHLRRELEALLAAAATAGPSAAVPTCADWTVADLLDHLGEGYRRAAASVGAASEPDVPPPADGPREAHEHLQAVLGAAGATAPAWTWDGTDATAGFWSRRMAHETAVHRVDVELAAGLEPEPDDALAADGVDELLRVFAAGDWSDLPQPGPPATVVLRVPGGRAWTVRAEPTSLAVVDGAAGPHDEHGPADATVRARAGALLLWLWGRPHGDLDVSGDAAAAHALAERLRAVTT